MQFVSQAKSIARHTIQGLSVASMAVQSRVTEQILMGFPVASEWPSQLRREDHGASLLLATCPKKEQQHAAKLSLRSKQSGSS